MKRFTSVLLAIASAATGVPVAGARPHYGGTLRLEVQGAIRSMDPAVAPRDSTERRLRDRVLPLVFETLIGIDPDGGLRPALARWWTTDARAARWQILLRPGVVLHDGSPLLPRHVVEALRSLNKDWRVTADGDIVSIETPEPRQDLPWDLTLPESAILVRSAAGALLGTGPFRLEALGPSRITLRAHERHWGGRPFVDGVQIEMSRDLPTQLANLEAGRADLVSVQPTDLRRLAQRRLGWVASRPLELFALVFESHRASPAFEAVRRTLSLGIDRAAIARVSMQGHAEPAEGLLPAWLSGYPSFALASSTRAMTRQAVLGLPLDQRNLTIRVDRDDAGARQMAERIALDAREAGLTATVRSSADVLPRPDLRLIRITLDATSPDRALARLTASLPPRVRPPAAAPPLVVGPELERVHATESSILEPAVVVPIVHVSEIYGFGQRVDSWEGGVVRPDGSWNLANVWLAPDSRP